MKPIEWFVTVHHDVLGLDSCRTDEYGTSQVTRLMPFYSRFRDCSDAWATRTEDLEVIPAYESITLEDRFIVHAPDERWAAAMVMVGHYSALANLACRELGAPPEVEVFWSGDYIIPRLQHNRKRGTWVYTQIGVGFVIRAVRTDAMHGGWN